MTSQKFGGDWTAKKLNIFTSYLDAYLIALQNQKFKKIYIAVMQMKNSVRLSMTLTGALTGGFCS